MEKIKEALAKVKSQKKVVSKTQGEKKSESVSQSTNYGDIGYIEYTHSTVIDLDDKHLENNRIVSQLSHNVDSSSFDSLRTQVLQKMEENNWKTLAIVSPTPESGKTVVSINLAISIAHQPQKTVALVDFDLRRPKLATYLGINPVKSMNDFLEDRATLPEVMINPGIQRIVVLPTTRSISRPADLLSSSKVEYLIKDLKSRYKSRIVIFDLPPLLGTDDAMVLLPQVDCVLMVLANGVATQAEIEDAMHMLPKESLLGVVYNKAEVESKAYYY